MTKVHIHPSSALWLAGLFVFGRQKTVSYLLPILLHELCHVAAALLLKRKIASVSLGGSGLLIDIVGVLSYKEQIVISASGPLGSFVLYVLFKAAYSECAMISLVLGLLNLLPFSSFDGRGIVYPLLCTLVSLDKCDGICRALDVIGTAVLTAAAITALVVTRSNASVLFLAIYLFSITFLKNDGIF